MNLSEQLDRIADVFCRNPEYYKSLVYSGRVDDALFTIEIEAGIYDDEPEEGFDRG